MRNLPHMKKLFHWLKLLFTARKKREYPYHPTECKTYDADPLFNAADEPLSNFAMMIPHAETRLQEFTEDPRGVPIYAECPAQGEPCACSGACMHIIGWNRDMNAIIAHREHIQQVNQLRQEGLNRLYQDVPNSGDSIYPSTSDSHSS